MPASASSTSASSSQPRTTLPTHSETRAAIDAGLQAEIRLMRSGATTHETLAALAAAPSEEDEEATALAQSQRLASRTKTIRDLETCKRGLEREIERAEERVKRRRAQLEDLRQVADGVERGRAAHRPDAAPPTVSASAYEELKKNFLKFAARQYPAPGTVMQTTRKEKDFWHVVAEAIEGKHTTEHGDDVVAFDPEVELPLAELLLQNGLAFRPDASGKLIALTPELLLGDDE